jgi:hypothetical protein
MAVYQNAAMILCLGSLFFQRAEGIMKVTIYGPKSNGRHDALLQVSPGVPFLEVNGVVSKLDSKPVTKTNRRYCYSFWTKSGIRYIEPNETNKDYQENFDQIQKIWSRAKLKRENPFKTKKKAPKTEFDNLKTKDGFTHKADKKVSGQTSTNPYGRRLASAESVFATS